MRILFTFTILFFLLFCGIHGFTNSTTFPNDRRKHYIVYMGSRFFNNSEALISSNHDMLSWVTGSIKEAKKATIYHYHKSFRGFSALLTPTQAEQLSKNESVISVFEDRVGHLHTTRSWDFMGAPAKSLFSIQSNRKDYDVIVGHLDGGIWPEAPSFRPDGIGPVPERWRGQCTDSFCSRKIIGSRWYSRGYEQEYGPIWQKGQRYYYSSRDDFGHGTHTASIAVGQLVPDVELQGMGRHDVRGGAPGARLAVYKVCWFNGCTCTDVLKAFDDSIDDGVDLITISAGWDIEDGRPGFMDDCFSIGSLHAFEKGILVSSSGANRAEPKTVCNAAPWMLTVAASSIDREFVSPLYLGNSLVLKGKASTRFYTAGYYPLIYAASAALPWVYPDRASACEENTLDSRLIWGKIVICSMEQAQADKVAKAEVVRSGGGIGLVLIDPYQEQEEVEDYPTSTTVIDGNDAKKLDAYMRSSQNPSAYIRPSKAVLNVKPAPQMAFFSSKGPGSAPDIIKPDITAPGLNILAAYPGWDLEDPSTPSFIFNSGTSMACPHASGVAALIKATHRNWSPAAIKSALMTTVTHLDNTGQPIKSGKAKATPFDMGSGHLNPTRALNLGLVYDYNMNDVVAYLCNMDNAWHLGYLLNARVYCSNPSTPTYNLNYPSIAVSDLRGPTTVTRTVTYVGREGDPKTFHVEIENPEGVSLQVNPSVLDFTRGQKTVTYTVDVQPTERSGRYVFGAITWINDVHSVRSAVAVRVV